MYTNTTIHLHNIINHSAVNGPGERFVVWVQGCPFHCEGCFNPQTHALAGGFELYVEALAAQINAVPDIRGITLTGGEPLLQAQSVLALLKRVRADLDVLVFSGFTVEEALKDPLKKQILHRADASLLGRYNKDLPHPFYGKKLVIKQGGQIKKEELTPWLKTEVILQGETVSITGLFKQKEEQE